MIKSVLILSLLILTINFNSFGAEDNASNSKNILVLFSLTPTMPAYRVILDGIRQKLTEEFGDSYTLNNEYLETELYPQGEYPKEKFDLYNAKYRDSKLDLLICVGFNIAKIVKENADDQLINLPAIVLDYDLSGYGRPFDFQLNRNTTEIRLKMDVNRTINEALRIFPGTLSIYFITGTSKNDQIILDISREAVKNIPKTIKTTFIIEQGMDELLKVVNKLPVNSLIFITSFSSDDKMVPYHNTEAVRLISKSSNVPVFTYTDTGIGEGSFGGDIMSFRKVGPLTGETAVKILNGTDPNSIKISDKDYYQYLLDWRELKRWNLTGLENRKKDSTLLYEEITFFGKYKWYLISGIVFMVIQTLLIASLIRVNRLQRSLAKQMVEAERRYINIIHQDKIAGFGMLTASLSHEMNQPLMAILSTSQAGLRFIESKNTDPGLLKEIFDNIVEDNKRAAAILGSIRGMLKLEKREKGKTNLNDLIRDVENLHLRWATELCYEINLQLPDTPVFVYADFIQIQQVLLNFISNACHSIEISKDCIHLINIIESIDNEYVSVSVRDFGRGIDESVSNNLFEPFVTSRKDGAGIGLAISRYIIEDHKGKIWARNMADGGAEFSFNLKIYNE